MLVAVFPNQDYFKHDEIPSILSDSHYIIEVPDDADLDDYMEEYFLAVDLGSTCERSTVH